MIIFGLGVREVNDGCDEGLGRRAGAISPLPTGGNPPNR